MIKKLNITPQKFAILVSIILSILLLIVMIIQRLSWESIAITIACFIFFSYFIVKALFKNFIYQNVRLIYKLINKTRASKKEEFLFEKITPNKPLDEVTQEVITWAIQKNEEIKHLKDNEAFRREFLQNLAHEIMTPLFTAQGYLYSLKDGAIEDKELATEFLDKAAQSVERLSELTKDIVNISKLESGQTVLEKSHFFIQDLIKEVFDEFELIRKERHAIFTFKTGSTAQIQVYADRNRIRQVLVNLIQNAIKYGQIGIEVSAGCYIIDPDTAYIEISDNGPGIEQSHLTRLFERFYRTDKGRDRKIGGTGLGLAIVKHIIEAHGQSVNVRSTVQIGTTFGFTLPKKIKKD